MSKLRLFFDKPKIKYTSELLVAFGTLDSYNSIREDESMLYRKGANIRYDGVIEKCHKEFEYVDDIRNADVAVLPYKMNSSTESMEFFDICKRNNIKCITFLNDDSDAKFPVDPNWVFIYRTSFDKKTRLPNEFAMPAFSHDYFQGKYITEFSDITIGFCGHTQHGRLKYINALQSCPEFKTSFIRRSGFWAPGINKQIARKEYVENIENNLFSFCYRGAGNFSYRFYEILSLGRIPILINTDCVFPFSQLYDLNDIVIIIDEKTQAENMNQIILDYFNKNKANGKLIEIQKQNRKIYEKYFSPCGFIENVRSQIEHTIMDKNGSDRKTQDH